VEAGNKPGRLSGLQLRSDGHLDLRAHAQPDGTILIAYWVDKGGIGDWRLAHGYLLRREEVAQLGTLTGQIRRAS